MALLPANATPPGLSVGKDRESLFAGDRVAEFARDDGVHEPLAQRVHVPAAELDGEILDRVPAHALGQHQCLETGRCVTTSGDSEPAASEDE